MYEVSNLFSQKKKLKLDWAVDGAPLQISMRVANVANSMTDRQTDGLALAHPYHEGRSCSKFDKLCPVV